MRLKLGLAASTLTVASLLVFAVPASAAPADQPDTTVDDSTPEPEPAPDADETTGWLTGAATVGADPAGQPSDVSPDRSDEQTQVIPTTTTTTTTLPPPPPTLPFGLPFNSGEGRRAVYSKSAQQVWAVDSAGTVIKTHRVSGRQVWCDPRPGEYRVFSRSRYTFALSNPDIIWGYMVRFAKGCEGGNIGFHEIPTNSRTGYRVQSVSQLGTPLSGGCVRQAIPDAQWMWNWAYVGTKVVVLP